MNTARRLFPDNGPIGSKGIVGPMGETLLERERRERAEAQADQEIEQQLAGMELTVAELTDGLDMRGMLGSKLKSKSQEIERSPSQQLTRMIDDLDDEIRDLEGDRIRRKAGLEVMLKVVEDARKAKVDEFASAIKAAQEHIREFQAGRKAEEQRAAAKVAHIHESTERELAALDKMIASKRQLLENLKA